MLVPVNCPTCRKEVLAEAKTDRWGAVCPACHTQLATPAGFPPGTVLGGYTIESRLASSSAEETYLGTQAVLGRQVMLKILPPDMVDDAESFGRFQRQMKVTAALRHPGILSALDAGQDAGLHYLATEYKPGRTLKECLAARGGRLPEAEALKLALGLAEALRYAWDEHKIVHRNLKPGSIWMTDAGPAVLLDLGLARSYRDATAQVTMAGFTVGTPEYMSPEQARGDEAMDFRADVYSLGIVLYQCLVGATPFAGSNPLEIVGRHLDEKPVPAGQRSPQVSARCSALIDRMLAKAPEQRCGSWSEVIQELRAVAAGEPAAAPARGASPPRPPPPARAGTRPPPPGPRPGTCAPSAAAARNPEAIRSEAAFKRKLWLLYAIPPAVMILAILVMYRTMQRSRAPQPPARPVPAASATAPDSSPATAVAEPASASEPTVPAPADTGRREEEMLDYARRYYREHPADYAGAIAKLAAVKDQLAGSKYALMAEEAITGVEADRAKAATAVVAGLRKQADALAAVGDFAAAIALHEDYTGPLEAETAAGRAAAARDLQRRRQQADASASEEAKALARQAEEATTAATKACLNGRPAELAAATRQLQALPDAAAKTADAQAWLALLTTAGQLDMRIAQTFTAAMGKPAQVRFEKDGVVEVEVKAVEGGIVQADRLVREADGSLKGRIDMRFTPAELHLNERVARLRQGQAPERELLAGLAAWRGGNRRLAAECFRTVDTPLAQALLAQCGE